jgi:hypothetical protein
MSTLLIIFKIAWHIATIFQVKGILKLVYLICMLIVDISEAMFLLASTAASKSEPRPLKGLEVSRRPRKIKAEQL